jgi:glutamate dehydrogenase
MRAVRDLTADVLGTGDGDVSGRLAAWHDSQPRAIDRAAESVQELTEGALTVSRLSVAAGLLADLARSA